MCRVPFSALPAERLKNGAKSAEARTFIGSVFGSGQAAIARRKQVVAIVRVPAVDFGTCHHSNAKSYLQGKRQAVRPMRKLM